MSPSPRFCSGWAKASADQAVESGTPGHRSAMAQTSNRHNGYAGKEDQFHHHHDQAYGKDQQRLMPRESRDIIADEHDRQQDDAGDAKDAKARGFEFDEQGEQAQPEQDWGGGIKILRQLLRPSDLELPDHIVPGPVFLRQQFID